tara:strand:- start:10 stop:585 length:576 start_codon:yes stop_codon:yes gene_type:complete
MADQLPVNFATPTEGSIASYNYTDVADGTGVIVFYGAITEDDSGSDYILTTKTTPSRGIAENRYINQTNSPYDFDLTAFNLPRTVKGTATAHFEIAVGSTNAVTPTVQVQKVSNSVVTNVSAVITGPTQATNAYVYNMDIPLTKTHFKKGDILRVVVTHNTAADTDINCDPSGERYNALPLQFHIPFDLDL